MGVTKHKHQMIDADAHFTVDATTRNISNDNLEKNVIMQGDHNSERFTFAIPRYIEGHDMMLCNHVHVAYIDTQTSGRGKQYSTGVYLVNDLELHPEKKDYLQCSWLISSNATRFEGALNFMLILSCMEGDMVTYRWKTNVFEGIHVAASLDSELVFEDEYVDIIEQWKNSVMEHFTELVNIGMDSKAANVKAELHETLTAELTEHLQTHIDEFNDTLDTGINDINQAIETFDEILKTEITSMDSDIAILEARMDTFTALEEGSTTGDAELADIRAGANGKVYKNAGDAVRKQLSTKSNRYETIHKKTGKNLFDKDSVTLGAYLNGTETPVPNDSSFYSDYIPVLGDTAYSVNITEGGGRYICFYDADYSIIEGGFSIESISGVNTFNTPVDARFMRLSSYASIIEKLQIEKGDVVTDYEAYYEYEPIRKLEIALNESNKKHLMKNPSKNMFDKDAIISGYYLMGGGEFASNSSSFVSDFMPVTGGKTYAISNNSGGGRYICFYDDKDNPSLVTGITMVSLYDAKTSSFTVPEYANYMRISHFLNAVDELQIEEGSEITDYEPYFEYRPLHTFKVDVDNRLTNLEAAVFNTCVDYESVERDIQDNVIVELSNFPMRIKNGMSMSFYGNFNEFTSMLIGKGHDTYRGRWFKIDNKNVTYYQYENMASVAKTVAHGLTISRYIDVHIVNDGEQFILSINTSSGTFTSNFDSAYDSNGAAFVMSETDMTGCSFSATSKMFDKDVWMFGDSYFGISNSRVIGQLRKLGYFDNVLIDGLAGIGSSASYTELLKCLRFATPKTLIWCIGMNDGTESYTSYLNLLVELCEKKGINLILTKIPTVPERDKAGINKAVIDTGLRYIDFYKAVGANESGKWYTGYLDTDGVHPTELGAQALAMRMLIDAPEITRH